MTNETNTEYQELMNKAIEHSTLLNKIIKDGKDVSEYSDDLLVHSLSLQFEKINLEEVGEWVSNYAVDIVEELDACCDVLVTASFMHILIDELKKRDLPSVALNVKRLGMVTVLTNFVLSNLIKNKDGSYSTLSKALSRVIENNMSKVTTDVEEFKTWKAPADEALKPKSVVADGDRYYFLINEDGKLRKPSHFKSVDLSDLVLEYENEFLNS